MLRYLCSKFANPKNMILLKIHYFMVADISFVFVTDKLPLFHRITSKHSLTSLAILLKDIIMLRSC